MKTMCEEDVQRYNATRMDRDNDATFAGVNCNKTGENVGG